MAQKLPKLEIMKPIADIMNNIHPTMFIVLFLQYGIEITQSHNLPETTDLSE